MDVHDLEGLRRSAAMAPLSPDELDRLFGAAMRMARERDQIRSVLADLPTSFAEVRKALNDLQRLVGGPPGA